MQSNTNARAATWFKRATDVSAAAPAPTADARQQQAEDLYRMRSEVRKLETDWRFAAYQSYRAKAGPSNVPAGTIGGGVLPSQGGAEVAYRPPGIGFRDERVLELYGRVLWSNQPKSIRIDDDTLQGGIGLRYKPFREHTFYLCAERLIAIGDQALNAWLVQATYAWYDGYDLKPGRSSWNYTLVYGDLGYTFGSSTIGAFYGEARQGWTFNFDDTWLVTPHLVVNGRSQWPENGDVNYIEAGAGVALKVLFGKTFYEGHRANFELTAQYKKGWGASPGGWMFGAALRF